MLLFFMMLSTKFRNKRDVFRRHGRLKKVRLLEEKGDGCKAVIIDKKWKMKIFESNGQLVQLFDIKKFIFQDLSKHI